MKKVFVVHRWDGGPESDWYPWLKNELERKGFIVYIPEMPNTQHPKTEEWLPYLKKIVGRWDSNTLFVGHSVGCQAILRLLESSDKKVGGVYLVAPWMKLVNLTAEELEIAKPWLEALVDWDKVKNKTGKFIAFFSDNDPWVPVDQTRFFQEKLGAEVHVEKGKGHFTEEDEVVNAPWLLAQFINK